MRGEGWTWAFICRVFDFLTSFSSAQTNKYISPAPPKCPTGQGKWISYPFLFSSYSIAIIPSVPPITDAVLCNTTTESYHVAWKSPTHVIIGDKTGLAYPDVLPLARCVSTLHSHNLHADPRIPDMHMDRQWNNVHDHPILIRPTYSRTS